MLCNKCGNKVKANQKTCRKCNSKIVLTKATPAFTIQKKFCPVCGGILDEKSICNNCNVKKNVPVEEVRSNKGFFVLFIVLSLILSIAAGSIFGVYMYTKNSQQDEPATDITQPEAPSEEILVLEDPVSAEARSWRYSLTEDENDLNEEENKLTEDDLK